MAGSVLGWLGWHWHDEQTAIERLREISAKVEFKAIGPAYLQAMLGSHFSYLCNRAKRVLIFGTDHGNALHIDDLKLRSLKSLEILVIINRSLDESSLKSICELSTLRALSLSYSSFDGSWLSHLVDLPQLDDLALWGSPLDDKALAQISRLKRLKSLSLTETGISDDGLKHLEELQSLETLDLSDNKITDSGIAHLMNLKSLRTLMIGHTRVTPAAVAKLKAAIPGLSVRDWLGEFRGG